MASAKNVTPGPLYADGTPRLSHDEALRFRALLEHAVSDIEKSGHACNVREHAFIFVRGWLNSVLAEERAS